MLIAIKIHAAVPNEQQFVYNGRCWPIARHHIMTLLRRVCRYQMVFKSVNRRTDITMANAHMVTFFAQ